MSITELAPAKLNLTLDVGARRPDGYHEITSVMQSAQQMFNISIRTILRGSSTSKKSNKFNLIAQKDKLVTSAHKNVFLVALSGNIKTRKPIS